MYSAWILIPWQQVRRDLLVMLDRFGEDEMGIRPFPTSWSVGQIFLHIADCEDNWLYGIVQGEVTPWIFCDAANYPSKEAIKTILDRAHQRTQTYLATLDWGDLKHSYQIPNGGRVSLQWIIWHVLEHEINHRGELSFILGSLGREGLDV